MVNRDFGKVKHLAAVQIALRQYKAIYATGGTALKAAEDNLNAIIEQSLEPR